MLRVLHSLFRVTVVGGLCMVICITAPIFAQPLKPTPRVDAPSPERHGLSRTGAVPKQLRVGIVHTYPHDPQAFTQGLLFADGQLYESTGLHGHSTVRKVAYETGRVQRKVHLPNHFFGEGLARADTRLVQLTWQRGKAFVYDATTLRRQGEFSYTGEGWGLCFTGTHFVMSDGSAQLVWRDPATFEIVRRVAVTSYGAPQPRLNELECVGETIYANVWREDVIVAINAQTGAVVARVDASVLKEQLTTEERRRADVLNGIAYHPETGHFFLTGKRWPKLFEVEFVE